MNGGTGHHGFSLVELMVAMVLGLLLVAAATQVFLSNRASYRFNEALATIQDNGRFALHTLTHDLRMSGYSGCPRSLDPNVSVISQDAVDAGVDEEDLFASIALPGADLPATAIADSDAFLVAYLRDHGVRVSVDSVGAEFKTAANPAGWKQDDILLVVDCLRGQGDLFTATTVSKSAGVVAIAHASDGNTTNKLTQTYTDRAKVLAPYMAMYYVGDTGETDAAGNPVQSLYRWHVFPSAADTTRVPEPLLQGVENLVIRYGVDDNADRAPDRYVDVDAVSDWGRVTALRLGLVLRSEHPVGAENETLALLGTTVEPPDDGYLRHAFTTTVALRNRAP